MTSYPIGAIIKERIRRTIAMYEVVDKEGNFVLLTSNKHLAELRAKAVGGSIIETYCLGTRR